MHLFLDIMLNANKTRDSFGVVKEGVTVPNLLYTIFYEFHEENANKIKAFEVIIHVTGILNHIYRIV